MSGLFRPNLGFLLSNMYSMFKENLWVEHTTWGEFPEEGLPHRERTPLSTAYRVTARENAMKDTVQIDCFEESDQWRDFPEGKGELALKCGGTENIRWNWPVESLPWGETSVEKLASSICLQSFTGNQIDLFSFQITDPVPWGFWEWHDVLTDWPAGNALDWNFAFIPGLAGEQISESQKYDQTMMHNCSTKVWWSPFPVPQ